MAKMILSTLTLLQQRKCCGNRCTNCPYIPTHKIGSTQTIDPILLEPVSVLEYYGVNVRTINTLENNGFYLINDLRNLQNNDIVNLKQKGINSIKNALLALLNGDNPVDLNFENAS